MQFNSLFSKSYPVPESECDENSVCRLPYLLRCMEDAAFADADRIGQGATLLREKYGLCWMIFQSEIEVTALPKAGDRVSVQTACCGVKGASVRRVYDVIFNGKPGIHCIQTWVVVHLSSRSLANPQRVPELMRDGFPAPPQSRSKIRTNLPLQFAGTGCVEGTDLDFNGHMNNVRYVERALPYLPHLTGAYRLQLAYRYELLQGQTYDCLTADAGDTKQIVFRFDGKDCFVMQYSKD